MKISKKSLHLGGVSLLPNHMAGVWSLLLTLTQRIQQYVVVLAILIDV